MTEAEKIQSKIKDLKKGNPTSMISQNFFLEAIVDLLVLLVDKDSKRK
jgi:hypothetical protein